MNLLQLPPGFRFHPTDEELVNIYLKAKVHGESCVFDFIEEKHVYGSNLNPWEIFADSCTPWITFGAANPEKVVYVFTSLTKKAKSCGGERRKEHHVKKSGCGTWHGETREQIVDNNNNVIGIKRMLVFQINDVTSIGSTKVAYYKMHEYVLSGYEHYALCRITLDTSKVAKLCPKANPKPKVNPKSKANKKRVALSESCHKESLPSTVCPSDPGIVNECQAFPVIEVGYGLTCEEIEQILMNSEDVEIPGSGFKNGTPLDPIDDATWLENDMEEVSNHSHLTENLSHNQALDDWFNVGSWAEEDFNNLLNDNNVQQQPPMKNISCCKLLGKRKSLEDQEYGSNTSKKFCM